MLRIPQKYGHIVYGVLQSGLTCAVATAISTLGAADLGNYLAHWLKSWLLSWILMLPLVLLAAPLIRKLSDLLVSRT